MTLGYPFTVLYKWEGVVLSIEEGCFLARLHDLFCDGPDYECEILLDKVSASDRPLVVEGAVFYYDIGYYKISPHQLVERAQIRFRRFPVWTEEEITCAKKEAKELRESLGWT